MDWFKKLMNGRYGGDQLSVVLVVLSIILLLVGRMVDVSVVVTLSYIPLLLAVFRMFSKDIKKRRMENYKVAMLFSPIYARVHKSKNRFRDLKTHKHFKCPSCHTTLRAPKGKDKIMVTCPKCKTKFTKKT